MFARSIVSTRRSTRDASVAAVCSLVLFAGGFGQTIPSAQAQDKTVPTAREILGPAAFVPIAKQPPAKIIIDQPLPDQLEKGIVVIQFRTENLRMSPVFGPAALKISPRIGHLHVTLDDGPWLWGHFSDQELIVGGLPPGPHKIKIELVSANHETLAEGVVKLEVPRRSLTPEPKGKPIADLPPAKLILDAPEPDLLAKGVALIRYRTENLRVAPVFGPAALAVSPRIGHLRVTVDDAPWHWLDASGQPVDVGYFPPGPHTIRIELVNANGEPLAQSVLKIEVPKR
ncbi:MAG: DUF6130 family protein [Gemmataceae bacterium]|nr:DUF6130 family protein [Gemmataceae bacterium]